jgi:hypothetical protein
MSGSLVTVSRELAKYKLDLVRVQEVKWDKGGTEPADIYTFFYGNGNVDCHLGTGTMSEVKRVEFISDRMSHLMLRGQWCVVIVLNVHAPT